MLSVPGHILGINHVQLLLWTQPHSKCSSWIELQSAGTQQLGNVTDTRRLVGQSPVKNEELGSWYIVDSRWHTVVKVKKRRVTSQISQLEGHICLVSVSKILCKHTYKLIPGHPRTAWMKTIQQDLKSNNLSLNEAIVARNHPDVHSGDWCLRLALRTPCGACQKKEETEEEEEEGDWKELLGHAGIKCI